MSYARDVLGHCDEPHPNNDPNSTYGIWCSEPVNHDGQHMYYGLDLWAGEDPPACLHSVTCMNVRSGRPCALLDERLSAG